jgi:hypothetical protein
VDGNWLQDLLHWYWVTPWQLVLLEVPNVVGSVAVGAWFGARLTGRTR